MGEIDDILQKARLWMTNAWNDHNKRNSSSLFWEYLFRTPKLNSVYPSRISAIIIIKRDWVFSWGLKKFLMLYSYQQTISWKIKVIFEYNATPDNKIQWSAIEKLEFNNDGLTEKSNVYYGAEDCRRKVEGNKTSIEKGRIW